MQNNKYSAEYMRSRNIEQLRGDIQEMRHELLQLRLKSATGHVASLSSDQRRLREAVARGLTVMTEKTINE